jgi:hypothetical protein
LRGQKNYRQNPYQNINCKKANKEGKHPKIALVTKRRLYILFAFLLANALYSSANSLKVSPNTDGSGKLSGGVRCFMAGLQAGWCFPQANLADDYGTFGTAGGTLQYLMKKRWMAGLEAGFIFGGNVKNDPFPNLRNPDGSITGGDGSDAVFKVFQRGSIAPVFRLGYVFPEKWPIKKGNKLGGYFISAGGGWLRNYTYIQDLSKKTAQFSDAYRIGYDRLSAGPAAGLWIGYLYLADHNRLNLQIELGYLAGFTKSRRFSFVNGTPAGILRRDDLIQLSLKFFFSIRSLDEKADYYY